MTASAQRAVAAPGELDVGELFRAHSSFAARVIQRMVGPGAHVEDILQETFLTAHRVRHTYDGNAKPTTWLYAIARNLCWRHRRSAQRRWSLLAKAKRLLDPPRAAVPYEQLEKSERARAVRAAIDALPFKQSEVFALYELENLKGTEIAELLGISEGTVWTRLHHARKGFEREMRRISPTGGEP